MESRKRVLCERMSHSRVFYCRLSYVRWLGFPQHTSGTGTALFSNFMMSE